MISRATIDKIFSAVRVEEIIGEYVQLKKTGSNYKGLSPFQDEKTPSFVVSPSKQIWKDFSSGKGGTAISFLMEIENFTYPEALRFLAKKYGIEIEEDKHELTEEQQAARDERDLLYKIHEVAADYFKNQLWQSEEGQAVGLSYFRERGLNDTVLEEFGLGYSPEQRNAFTQYALDKGYTREVLELSGLSIFGNEHSEGVDRFRERVIFPIHSFSGRVLGFGARILKSNVKTAKYLNSPETEIYHKSKILYGVSQAKQSISRKDLCILVEGYMDVISLHQAGVHHVVSSSGTSLTQDQIRLIKRLTRNITLIFDGDAPGIKASFRSIDMLLTEEMNVRVLLLPDGMDPDNFAQSRSQEEVEAYIAEKAVDFMTFKVQVLGAEAAEDPLKRTELIREIVRSIAHVPAGLQQEIWVQQASTLLGVSEQSLFAELGVQKAGIRKEEPRKEKLVGLQKVEKTSPWDAVDPLIVLEEKLIDLILKYGNMELKLKEGDQVVETTVAAWILHYFETDGYEVQLPLNQKIIKEIEDGLDHDTPRSGDFFLTLVDEELTRKAADALMPDYEPSNWGKYNIYFSTEEEDVEEVVLEVINRHRRALVVRMISDLKKEIQELPPEERSTLYERIMMMNKLKIELDKRLYRIL